MLSCWQDCICLVAPAPYNDKSLAQFDFKTDMDLTGDGRPFPIGYHSFSASAFFSKADSFVQCTNFGPA